MSLEITGKLVEIYPTNQISEKFKKREFVLELTEPVNGINYINFAKMQLVQNKCEIMDRYHVGSNVKVNFNIKGTRYEKDGKTDYFTNLEAWRIESVGQAQQAPQQQYQQQSQYQQQAQQNNEDDLPF